MECVKLVTAIFGPNVCYITENSPYYWLGNTRGAYAECPNIQGNTYLYTNNIKSADCCFKGRNVTNMLNIYLPENSQTLNSFLVSNKMSLIGAEITWTDDSTNKRYYSPEANIYIYPVANVEQAKIDNGD